MSQPDVAEPGQAEPAAGPDVDAGARAAEEARVSDTSLQRAVSDSADAPAQALTILTYAQSAADNLVNEAQARADALISDATSKAEKMVADATQQSDSMIEEATQRANAMVEAAMAASLTSVVMSRTNDWSILSLSMGKRFR